MDSHNIMKGWIVLHILSYKSDEDKKVSELIGKEPAHEFRKSLVQVSAIGGMSLEYGEDSLTAGNAILYIHGMSVEVQETPMRIIELIKAEL